MTDLERIALLTDHRLKELESRAVVVRQVERDVDHLKLQVGHVEAILIELRAECGARDTHNRQSLARLHQRFDAIETADAREEGREAGERAERTRTLRLVGATVTATLMLAGVIVALLALVLHHQ